MTFITIKNAQVHGITRDGAVLLDDDDNGYRIEVGIEGVERLALLCDLAIKNCSSDELRSARAEAAENAA